jgi:hypothetical protein
MFNSACNYYRVEVPIKGLHAMQLAEGFIDNGKFPEDQSLQMIMSADIDLFYSLFNMDHIIKTMRDDLKPGPDMTGKMRYPPSIVFDLDDNIEWVHPTNPAFCYLGVRVPDGTMLGPGDEVGIRLDEESVILWKDKETKGDNMQTFDIATNLENLASVKRMSTMCDGFTFPSKHLGEYFKESWGIKDYYVFPNTIVPEDYLRPNLAPHEGVRILWQGGFSHAVDLAPLREAFTEVAKKYPQAKFVFWGSRYRGIWEGIPPEQIELVPWSDYAAYKPMRVMIDCDINICPLEDNLFNRCKSAIKWYEASIIPRPEATLAAKVVPYSEEIEDGKTGLLFDGPEEFAQKLGALIENAELRQELAANAKEWVMANRHYRATVPGLHEYYQDLRVRERAKWEETKLISVGV